MCRAFKKSETPNKVLISQFGRTKLRFFFAHFFADDTVAWTVSRIMEGRLLRKTPTSILV